MKVSASIPSSIASHPVATYAIAGAYLAAHLPFLAPSLEDIDSINFGMGLHEFDVAKHQPHPPGYVVYIALGRVSLAILRMVGWSADSIHLDAVALAVWSAIGGAVALIAAVDLFRSLSTLSMARHEIDQASGDHAGEVRANRRAAYALLLLATCPLFWMCGLRPMSDMPGLAMTLVAQALLVRGFTEPRSLVQGALVAAFAIGLRSQTAWLTIPLAVAALVRQKRKSRIRAVASTIGAFALGGLAWGIPLLWLSDGVNGYLRALGSQAGEDFAWVNMLWANPTPRKLAFTLYETFVLPWASLPLATTVIVLACAGVVMMVWRDRGALLAIAVGFGPYAVFHMLFQESITVRYSLPLVPPTAYVVASALAAMGRHARIGVAALVAAMLWVSIPGAMLYAREAHPAFRAIAEMTREAAAAKPAAVFAHYAVWRPLQAAATVLPLVAPTRNYEWLGLIEYWRRGGRAPVWFFADPIRSDLAVIDPQSLRRRTKYRWSAVDRPELSGTRPTGVDWYRLDPPGWFTGEGWALTPETGGIAKATGMGIDKRTIEAFVRRTGAGMTVMVGGRDLGATTDPPTLYDLAIDGRIVASWRLDPAREGQNFLRVIPVPEGIPGGDGDYARLTISARTEQPNTPMPEVAIRQFDIQPSDRLMIGFGAGWHEEEYENTTGRRWRWTSERSVLHVIPPRAVELMIRGESPMKYFDKPPTVRIAAASRVIDEFQPAADFERRVVIPAADVLGANGEIAIETDPIYLPGQAEGTADVRHLGLRLFEIRVEPVTR